MYYAIIAEDRDDSLEQRLKAREKHLARLKQLQDQGRLLLAGPHPMIDSDDPGPA
ncbi:MAG: YciI family protein, partial [Candidatus Thiodiazotropha sp.]